jgi:hypothetical protein
MRLERTSHQSTHVLMRAHYIGLYALVDGKKRRKREELQPDEEKAGGPE